MRKMEVRKSAMTLFMIGLLVMTFFIPCLSPVKNLSSSKSLYAKVVTASDNSEPGQSQNQSVNIVEEEEEYTTEEECAVETQLPAVITISFSSPNLFFNEHFVEVSGPPPWA
jgi:hypothetical protein